ncbi:MAG TPA: HAMP domain-containing sensor histidine kinase [Ktedonobacteraceae bacterium]|nr:HAMP domain-containing sensor histidine kinase [Ktedonobacteraceae bacterium]
MASLLASKGKHLSSLLFARFDTAKMSRSPLAFISMFWLIVLFFVPYTMPGNTYEGLGAYGALAVVPVTFAAFVWERKGGIFSTLLIVIGLACMNWLEVGFHWPMSLLRTWLLGGIGLFIFGTVTGQLRSTSRLLALAHVKSLQAELAMARAYEQQVELNTLKDQFLFNVSHELRTPLTQVYGYLQLLEEYHHTLSNEKRTMFLSQSVQGCEELLLLITNLLDASRTEREMKAPQMEDLLLVRVVHELLDQFEPQQREKHPVHLDIAEDLQVIADAQHLRQILRNLLSNAFKYAPAHTPVEISATLKSVSAQGKFVCLCVRDFGPGIPPADIPLLFAKFVRLQRDMGGPARGNGLGLYISKHLVEGMGGSIWVESSGIAGQGSSFYFTLPARVPAEEKV